MKVGALRPPRASMPVSAGFPRRGRIPSNRGRLIEAAVKAAMEKHCTKLLENTPRRGTGVSLPTSKQVRHLLSTYDNIEDSVFVLQSLGHRHRSLQKEIAPVARILRATRQHVLDFLSDFQIVPVNPSKRVNFGHDEIVGVISTDDESRDREIVEIVRRGFVRGDTLFRPQHVVVLKYAAPHPTGQGAVDRKDEDHGETKEGNSSGG